MLFTANDDDSDETAGEFQRGCRVRDAIAVEPMKIHQRRVVFAYVKPLQEAAPGRNVVQPWQQPVVLIEHENNVGDRGLLDADPNAVEITVTGNILTVAGEKKQEKEEKERGEEQERKKRKAET